MNRPFATLMLLASLALTGVVRGESVRRDPTQPPPSYGPRPAKAASPAESFHPQQVVTVDGKRYLVWQGRRLAVGDMLQGARIERIEETEVWLRTENGLRKLPMFAGVEKKREGTR